MSFMYRRADILPVPSHAVSLPQRHMLLNVYAGQPAWRMTDTLECVLLSISAGLLSLLLAIVVAGAL
jgi:hypothetical protein